jgi:hypothetical protein
MVYEQRSERFVKFRSPWLGLGRRIRFQPVGHVVRWAIGFLRGLGLGWHRAARGLDSGLERQP